MYKHIYLCFLRLTRMSNRNFRLTQIDHATAMGNRPPRHLTELEDFKRLLVGEFFYDLARGKNVFVFSVSENKDILVDKNRRFDHACCIIAWGLDEIHLPTPSLSSEEQVKLLVDEVCLYACVAISIHETVCVAVCILLQ